MNEQEYKFEGGHIKYRYPNIFEAMRLLSKISDGIGDSQSAQLEAIADIMESLQPFLVEVELSGSKLEWDQIVSEYVMIPHLQNVGLDIINAINQQNKKRKARKKS